jgi:hypothetical protein
VFQMECKECGTKFEGNFCPECGKSTNKNKDSDFWKYLTFKKGWMNSLVIWMLIWGLFNMIFAPILNGILLVGFANLIYYTKSLKITYIFGGFWAIIAIIQAFASVYLDYPFTLIFAVVNGSLAFSILYMRSKNKEMTS